MLHRHLHPHVGLTRETNGRRLGTFLKAACSEISEQEKSLHLFSRGLKGRTHYVGFNVEELSVLEIRRRKTRRKYMPACSAQQLRGSCNSSCRLQVPIRPVTNAGCLLPFQSLPYHVTYPYSILSRQYLFTPRLEHLTTLLLDTLPCYDITRLHF